MSEICQVLEPYGAVWGRDGRIIFGNNGRTRLSVVSASGGTPQTIDVRYPQGKTAAGIYFDWISFLPGENQIFVSSEFPYWSPRIIDLQTGHQTSLDIQGNSFEYLPTGHLLIGREGRLDAIPFNLDRKEVTGDPVQVIFGVSSRTGPPQYTVSHNGLLVYAKGSWSGGPTRFAWIDSSGEAEFLPLPVGNYGRFDLSPDGSQLAVEVISSNHPTIHVFNLAGGNPTQLTAPGKHHDPIWRSDGNSLIYTTVDEGRWLAIEEDLQRITRIDTLCIFESPHKAMWISPDGRYLGIVRFSDQESYSSIFYMDLEQGGDLHEFAANPMLRESVASLSPDGRYVAYTSNESGTYEVYVRPFPPKKDHWRISTAGGTAAIWSSDGRHIFYRMGNQVYRTGITDDQDFQQESEERIVEIPFASNTSQSFKLSPNGERFLVLLSDEEDQKIRHLNLVTNWFTELERLVPTDN